jgi:AraC-like DNA-binding protein
MPRIYTESADCFDRAAFPLLVDPMKSHGAWPLHYHAYEELVIIEAGSVEHLVNQDQRHPLLAGDVFVIKPNSAHGYENPNGLDVVTLRFDIERLALPHEAMRAIPGYHALFELEPRSRTQHGFESHLHLSMSELKHTLALAGELKGELQRREPGYEFVALSIFSSLIGFLCRCYNRTTSPKSRNLLRVEKAVRYLERHQQDDVSILQLTEQTGQSVNSLLRDFKFATGQSPIQYLLGLRLRNAADMLLASPEKNVTEIALSCGFNDSNYFSRQFRRQMKVSPTEYRRQGANVERGSRNMERGTKEGM